MSKYFDPARMVIAAVNVDHNIIVDLAKKYFVVNGNTTWGNSCKELADKSTAQFTGGIICVR